MSAEIKMPRLGANDDTVVLTKILVPSGEFVSKDQKIATIETSKQTSDLKSTSSGIITWNYKANDEISVGVVVAFINKKESDIEKVAPPPPASSLKLTEKAQKLVETHKIDLSLLPKDRIIREKDILPLIQKPFSIAEIDSNRVLIYGAGGLAKVAIEIIRANHEYKIHGVISSKYPELKEFYGIPVLGDDDVLPKLFDKNLHKIVSAVEFGRDFAGNKKQIRKSVFEKLAPLGFEFVNTIHRSAIIEPSAEIGIGTIICAGAIIGSYTRIGNDCIINSNAVVSHSCIISDHCHIAAGATLAGRVIVGENTLIGQNVSVYVDVKIGKNVVIENGCSIFKNVPDNSVVHFGR